MKVSFKDITALSKDNCLFAGSFDRNCFKYLGNNFSVIRTEPFDISLSKQSNGKVQVSFNTSVLLEGACDRCLSATDFNVDVCVNEMFEICDGSIVTDDDLGFYSYIEDDNLDVDELILDEILVNFPAKILCQDDCKGLCPMCGSNRNITSCECDVTVLDPRMAQFLDVFNSFKEV